VRRKDNGWSYRVDLGPDPATGKRRQLAKQGFRTRKEAEAALGAVLTSIARGSVVDRSTTTTEEFLRDWLSSQEHRLRATTLYSYENTLPGAAVWTIPLFVLAANNSTGTPIPRQRSRALPSAAQRLVHRNTAPRIRDSTGFPFDIAADAIPCGSRPKPPIMRFLPLFCSVLFWTFRW
jgi:hypothetical protein